jgi:S1-C subfamily serine protease
MNIRSLLAGSLLLALGLPQTHAATDASKVRKSLARIVNSTLEPNYRMPWLPGATETGSGTGWIVSGKNKRVVTNAHVVSNARFLTLEKEGDPKKYIATVEHVAHDCDLAVLKLKDESFFTDTLPLELGAIPEIESEVSVYGYPIGGERLSVTRGIVSRIDFRPYAHSNVDSHLTIQIDAAINPGNSGGPVLQNGKVVGVAFQGFSGDVAQNVGYMIPTPVVKRFLKDIEDGSYDRYMDLSISTINTLNPALRKALNLPGQDTGLLVTRVMAGGAADGSLKPGDVILAIDKIPVAADGTVELDGDRVQMAEIAERKFKGDSLTFELIRDGKKVEQKLTFNSPWTFDMQSNRFDIAPRYLIHGGLMFQPLSRNLMAAFQFQNPRLDYVFNQYISRELYKDNPDVVILSGILPDPINVYAAEFREAILDDVNGVKIKTLNDLASAVAKETEFDVFTFRGSGRPLVLERKAVKEAIQRIQSRYGVTSDRNLSENHH